MNYSTLLAYVTQKVKSDLILPELQQHLLESESEREREKEREREREREGERDGPDSSSELIK